VLEVLEAALMVHTQLVMLVVAQLTLVAEAVEQDTLKILQVQVAQES
tara:strand:+ start:412 stop:552 length:141 start_codon:yes stop_codon:yes gene_type:complete